MGVKADYKTYPHSDANAWYTLSDFEHPDVRDHIVDMFEDVCQRYDIDGIELDFIRHPLFLRPNPTGQPAEPQHLEMMTQMVRRIRAVTDRESIKRGRPILVTVRAPLSVQSCRDLGLDIEAWLQQDLMDIMIAGQDYIQMAVASSLKNMVDLGHKHHVPVYALLVPPKPYKRYRHDDRAWRAAAMNRWYWGADGIYLFNLFPTEPDDRFSQLGSVDSLKGRDKVYAIDNPDQESVLGTFKMVMVGDNRLPLDVVQGKPVTARLPVGEDIVANTPAGKTVSALLRVRLSQAVVGDTLRVRFENMSLGKAAPHKPLTDKPSAAWFHVTVPPELVKPGYNDIVLQRETSEVGKDAVQVDGLDLVVTYTGNDQKNVSSP